MKPLIKICGISNLDFLNEVIVLNGVHFIGFIFHETSPRNVTEDFLNAIIDYDFQDKRPVCVYVNATSDFINKDNKNMLKNRVSEGRRILLS